MKSQAEVLQALGEILQDEEFVQMLVENTKKIRHFAIISRGGHGYVTPVEEFIDSLVYLHSIEGFLVLESVQAEYAEFLENWSNAETDIVAMAPAHRDLILRTLGLAPPAEVDGEEVGA